MLKGQRGLVKALGNHPFGVLNGTSHLQWFDCHCSGLKRLSLLACTMHIQKSFSFFQCASGTVLLALVDNSLKGQRKSKRSTVLSDNKMKPEMTLPQCQGKGNLFFFSFFFLLPICVHACIYICIRKSPHSLNAVTSL